MSATRIDVVVIVGASIAGLRTAQALRARGYTGHLALVDEDVHAPYSRPALSKRFLTSQIEPADIRLRDADHLDAEWYLGSTARHLDARGRVLTLSSGERLGFDRLVIATGSKPRWPRAIPRLPGITALHTTEDAIRLRNQLARCRTVVVIGGGLIATEVAAAARSMELDVTIVHRGPALFSKVLGPAVGEVVTRLHRRLGVRVHLDSGIAEIEQRDGQFSGLRLRDGSRIRADLAVLGTGAVPAVEWARGSGVNADDGVLCDASLRAVGAPGIYAAGDVATWPHPCFGGRLTRVGHVVNAAMSGATVAENLLQPAGTIAFNSIPEFASEQYGTNIRACGLTGAGFAFRWVSTERAGDARVGLFLDRGRPVGIVAINAIRRFTDMRRRMRLI